MTWWDTSDYTHDYSMARREHAFKLRVEGMTFKDIGNRLGVTRSRAEQIAIRGARVKRDEIFKRTGKFISISVMMS